MKILKLETLNLASLEGLNVIDFERGVLSDSQIFSIVGPTGSGKSTILDAICLPLYGRTPRYPMKRGERRRIKIIGEESEGEKNRLAPADPRNILTRGQKQGYSHLTFLANDGQVYRAEWSVLFRQKNYGNAERRLYCLESSRCDDGFRYKDGSRCEERECDWHELESRIIGLDFEQFLRTVLIAQGAFAGFLTADEDERYLLLEKLVGNGTLYRRIAEEIVKCRDTAANRHGELLARCQAFMSDVLTDNQLEMLRQQAVALREHEQQLRERTKLLDEQIGWYDTEARLQREAVRYQHDFTAAAETSERLRVKANKLSLHDATVDAVVLYRDRTASEQRTQHLSTQQRSLTKTIGDKDIEIAKLTEAFRRDGLNTYSVETLQQQKSQADKDVRDLREAIRLVTALTDKLTTQTLQQGKAQNLQKEEQELTTVLGSLTSDTLQQEVDTLTTSYTLMSSEDWAQHRQHLADDQPCPLCGATKHPYASEAVVMPVLKEMKLLLEQKRAKLKQHIERKTATEKRISEISGRQKELRHTLATLEKEIGQLRQAKDDMLQARPAWPDDGDALRAMLPDIEQLSQSAAKALNNYNALSHRLSSLEVERSRQQGMLKTVAEQMETEQAKAESSRKALATWLERYNNSACQPLNDADIAQLSAATDDWEAIRREKSLSDEAVTRTKTTLENHLALMENHSGTKPADDRETLMTQRAALAQESQQEELVRLSAILQRHDDACKALGTLREELSQARLSLTDWEQLASAVGNREGDTLRKMVQCYTLRFLVQHANAEIRKFNQRYELVQVKNSLGLRIIDHDRGNDIRDTTSLSGGETFIVSLGLALGLSALSAQGVAFSNIFIDEGFGSLDPDALATVIDALSMLQTAQGKKVCVISHTDTMSERITTQIRVLKNGNTGTSRIEIVGGGG